MMFRPRFAAAARSGWFVCALLLAAALSGCGAIGNKQNYQAARGHPNYNGRGAVAVLAYDARPDIQSQDKDPDFVGRQRNNYGIPFNVKTGSGRPLAADMTDAFASSIGSAGFTAHGVYAAPGITLDAARALLLKDPPHRALLLRIDQWESDTYKSTTLTYDLDAIVYDAHGAKLAEQRLNGEDHLDGSLFLAARKAREAVPKALPDKIEQLLNAQAIKAALQS